MESFPSGPYAEPAKKLLDRGSRSSQVSARLAV